MNARSRLFLVLFVGFELGLGALVYRLANQLEVRYRESAEELLVDTAQLVAALVAAETHADGTLDVEGLRQSVPAALERRFEARIFETVKAQVNLRIYVTDNQGIVRYDSTGRDEGQNYLKWRDVRRTLKGKYGARASEDSASEGAVMYVAAPVLWQQAIIGVVSVGKPTRSFAPFVAAAQRNLIIAGMTTGLGVILLAIGAALWFVKPWDGVSDYLKLVRARRPSDLPRWGRSTLGVIGAAFDDMRDALAGRNYVEEYVEALTHEIKSPLSAIRGAAELLDEPMAEPQRQRFLQHIRDESRRIHDIVERLLELSALEQRRGLADIERIDLGGAIHDAVDSLSALALAKAVTVTAEVPSERLIAGERFLIHRALSNLIQNAIEFSPPGGTVAIQLSETRHDHVLTVRDHGPGIPTYAKARLFDRFYSLPRPDTRKKSTGLGLSFVREIAALHHGQVDLGNHPDGGAIATLRIPKAV